MNMEFIPDFLIIPKRVYSNESLDTNDKFVYAVCYWFEHLKDGQCFASNDTISKIVGCHEKSVSRSLGRLIEEELLSVSYVGGVRFLKTLVMYGGNPQVTGGVTHRLPGGNPQVTQRSNSISNNNLSDKSEKEEDEITTELIDPEGNLLNPEKIKRVRKTTPDMLAVFEIFDDNPDRFVWKMRAIEREAASVLFKTWGIESLKKRYGAVKRHRSNPLCPQINKPSDFLQKMPNLEKFMTDI